MNGLERFRWFVIGFVIATIAAGTIIRVTKPEVNPCNEAAAEIIAMQQCLQNRPQCQIPNGPTAYKIYHDAQLTWRDCSDKSPGETSSVAR